MAIPYRINSTPEEQRRASYRLYGQDPLDAGVAPLGVMDLPPGGSFMPPPVAPIAAAPLPAPLPAQQPPSDAAQMAAGVPAQQPVEPMQAPTYGGGYPSEEKISISTTSGIPLPPGFAKRAETAANFELKGVNLLRKAQLIGAQAASQTAQAKLEASQVAAEKMKIERDQYEIQKNASLEEMAVKRQALADADSPTTFWEDRGAAAQIGAALSVAMGAFGSSLTGGPNYAMQIIDKAIDRDVQAKIQKRMAAKEALGEARLTLAEQGQMFGDIQKDILEEKALSYENAILQGDVLAASGGNKRVLAEWGLTRAGLLDKRNKFELDVADKTASRSQTTRQIERGPQVGAAARKAAAERSGTWVATGPTAGGYASSVPEKTQIQARVNAGQDAMGMLDEILALRGDEDFGKLPLTDQRAVIENNLESFAQRYNTFAGGSAAGVQEVASIRKGLKDPDRWFSPTSMAAVRSQRKTIVRGLENIESGLNPLEPGEKAPKRAREPMDPYKPTLHDR